MRLIGAVPAFLISGPLYCASVTGAGAAAVGATLQNDALCTFESDALESADLDAMASNAMIPSERNTRATGLDL
jgi:hypothetical protein